LSFTETSSSSPFVSHQRNSISTRLWGRSIKGSDEPPKNKMEQCPKPLVHLARNNKAAVVATLALLATASGLAHPSVSNAVDLNTMYGGAITLVSSTSGLIARISETGFYQAFTLVFLSEIGDKTFFVAGLLAMKTSKIVSFLGSMGALGAMTVLSVLIGQVFHAVPSGITDGVPIDDILACIAFAFFGLKTLKDALDLEEGESIMDEELAEAEETVEKSSTVGQITPW
jgi:hypothetical protein